MRTGSDNSKAGQGAQMMDPTAIEQSAFNPDGSMNTQIHAPITPRLAYSLEVLTAEVMTLFPDTQVEITQRTERGVGIEVTYGYDAVTDAALADVLSMLTSEPRVLDVTHDEREALVAVEVYNNAVTMDIRDGFGLSEAVTILANEEA